MHERRGYRGRVGEQGVIGWISNFDCILFGLLVMFAIAAFVQAKLWQSQQELSKVDRHNLTLEGKLSGFEGENKKIEEQLALRDPRTREEIQKEIDELKRQLALRDPRTREEIQKEIRRLQKRIAELEAEEVPSHQDMRKELIGLVGKLNSVVLVVDRSGSMLEPDRTGRNRWEPAKAVIKAWLDFLDVDRCALIVFSSDIDVLPKERKTFLRLRGPEAQTNRRKLNDELEKKQPEGGTFTRLALEEAYAYDGVDTIILFTDGCPNKGDTDVFDPNEAQAIYDLIARNERRKIPINVVGLGNYLLNEKDKAGNLPTFLRNVADRSGGTFLGR